MISAGRKFLNAVDGETKRGDANQSAPSQNELLGLPPASLENAEDAEKSMFATDADRWTRMKGKEVCLDLSVSI
jgi:hypothetical protein